MKQERLYLCGPMTGLPEHNYPAFHQAAKALESHGFDVVNPARFDADPRLTWHDYLRRGLTDLLTTDALALLPGWHDSVGARLEIYVAQSLAMPCRPVSAYLDEDLIEVTRVMPPVDG